MTDHNTLALFIIKTHRKTNRRVQRVSSTFHTLEPALSISDYKAS